MGKPASPEPRFSKGYGLICLFLLRPKLVDNIACQQVYVRLPVNGRRMGRPMADSNGRYIAYYRVSTDRQGQSGLGLEAQQAAVEQHLHGGNWTLIESYTEIESGKRNDRPELAKALAACKRQRATLVIAKLDRLARNVFLVAKLMESGVSFLAVDHPHAPKMMVQMLAVFAEHERDLISQRTRDALAAAKARGVELGKHGKVLASQNRAAADRFAHQIKPVISDLRASGITTIRDMAKALNQRQVPTANDRKWHPQTVHRLIQRIAAQPDLRAAS